MDYATGGTPNTWLVLGEDGCTLYTPASRVTTSTMAAASVVLERAGFTVEQVGKTDRGGDGCAGVPAKV